MRERFRIQVKCRALILLALWLLTVPLEWVAGALVAAAAHEFGHLMALWMLDVPVLGMEVDCSGAEIRTAPMEPREEVYCTLAGPVAGALVLLIAHQFPEAAVCATVQTLFNLLPVYPLDGGRAWRAWRNICCKPGQKRVQ